MSATGGEPQRLPAGSAPRAVNLLVSDLNQSVNFYRDVLGFALIDRAGSRATLGVDRSPIVRLETRAGVQPSPPRSTLGLFHFAILLPTRASLGRFAAHLGARGIAVGSADHAVSEALYLSDPDGLGIEVYADRPRETWRRSPSGELYLTTEPLDLQALLASGGGEPFSRLPTGTALGHMHLHVGDLDEAARFYERAVGFERTVWSYPGALFMSSGGYHHHLGVNTWARGARPPSPSQAQLLAWELRVPHLTDVEAIAARLAAAGYTAAKTTDSESDGVITSADPWGTTIAVVALREQEEVG